MSMEPGLGVVFANSEATGEVEEIVREMLSEPVEEIDLDREWLLENGDEVACAILEMLHSLGFRLPKEDEPSPRVVRKINNVPATEISTRSFAEISTAPRMRYLSCESEPGKSTGKKSRPSTNPRNGTHYASKSGDNSPLWENIVRAYEEKSDHVD